jgi:hypothetical protein
VLIATALAFGAALGILGSTNAGAGAPSDAHAAAAASGLPSASADAGPTATPPPSAELPSLLAKAGAHATRLDGLRQRVGCTIRGRFEKVDGDGAVDGWSELELRWVSRHGKTDSRVLRFVEDGKDKTEEQRKKDTEESDKDRAERRKRMELLLPFLPAVQPSYAFRWAEVDPRDPTRVRLTFTPRGEIGEKSYEGEAWLDRASGALLTMGFKLLRTPTFVHWVNVELAFAAPTDPGPALSRIHAEGSAGFLFLKRRFRIEATISDYTVYPD